MLINKQSGVALIFVLIIISLMSSAMMKVNDVWSGFFYFHKRVLEINKEKEELLSVQGIAMKKINRSVESSEILVSNEKIIVGGTALNLSIVSLTECFNINAFYTLRYKTKRARKALDYIAKEFGVDKDILKENSTYLIDTMNQNNLAQKIKGFDKNSLCYLPDDRVHININSINEGHADLIFILLLSRVPKDKIINVIKSKPAGGWIVVDEFLNLLLSRVNSTIRNELSSYFRDMLSIEHKYLMSIIKLDDDAGSYKLITMYKIQDGRARPIQHRYELRGWDA
ncbi:hypothetical protein [Yersinia nurmii]|nr:hypothetical protein [Yersinia nurmii]